ncbi:C25 family cysteine peptidase [Anaerophilus nitritogenes]|uniref:C25 family cysteine peptidase n=1 Tax=Anaerophilus nitritogenes TaxID=2498136 RepID=UPI00101D8252|nr:C25 family cysteine peptidase [Anaerophilus nitritogenes]
MKKVLRSRMLIFMFVVITISTQWSFVFGQVQTNQKIEVGGLMQVNADNGLDGVDVTVLESDSMHTVLKFEVGKFTMDKIDIDNLDYNKINCEGTSLDDELGAPELPRICRSITIPFSSEADISVVSAVYSDYENTPIIPSKGSITRDINPEDVPYTFGKIYKSDAFYPRNLASISDPFIMRELKGATVTINPFQYQPSTKTLRVYTSVTVEVTTGGKFNSNMLKSNSRSTLTKEFEEVYKNFFINYNDKNQYRALTSKEKGEMLIISYDQFLNAMEPFVQWKNSKGIRTTIVGRSSVSPNNNPKEIKNYIQNYYNKNPNLVYVLLVGDYAQISSPKYSTGVSDPEYTKVAGNDDYPDIFVGRFSAESIEDVKTQVQRTLDFEKNGYNMADWYKKGVGIASDEGSNISDAEHMDNIRKKLLDFDYTKVDRIYDPYASASSVTSSLNQGRGIINYCGHGAQTYWVTTRFSNSDVAALQNQGHLPFIISVSCVSGKFHTGTCFAEAWLRSKNNNGEPIGAIGTYMSTVNQPWIPPMVGQDAIVDLLCNKTRISFGGLCYTGASKMLDNGTSSDILTFNTWTVFGDPSIQL